MTRWITNLESEETLQRAVDTAQAALAAAPAGHERRQAQAMLEVTQFRLRDRNNTFRKIVDEHGGRVSVGEPHPTPWKTTEAIAADGIIGIYLQGAGDGATDQAAKQVYLGPTAGAGSV